MRSSQWTSANTVTSKPVHHPHMPLLSHRALMAQSGFSSCCAHLCYSLPVMTHATAGQRWQTVTDTVLLKQTESGAPFWNSLFLQSHGKWYARETPPPVSTLSFSSEFGTFSRIFLHSATGVLPPTTIKPHYSNVEREGWWYSACFFFFFITVRTPHEMTKNNNILVLMWGLII